MDERKLLKQAIQDRLGFQPKITPITHRTADVSKFETKGWAYIGHCRSVNCVDSSTCSGQLLHGWRKPKPNNGKNSMLWAIVCPKCHLLTSSAAFEKKVGKTLREYLGQPNQETLPMAPPVHVRPKFFDINYVMNHRIKNGWHYLLPDWPEIRWPTSKNSTEAQKISKEAQRRKVSRLCHFTRLEALESIKEKGVLPQQQLRQQNLSNFIQDHNMANNEGHTNFVRCSIEYPNLFNLDSFKSTKQPKPNSAIQWVVLVLNPNLLTQPGTKFCDTNAATENGSRIQPGTNGFNAMYKKVVNLPKHPPVKRTKAHLKSCPTNLQAEVLLEGKISFHEVLAIVVHDEQTQSHAQRIITI